MVQRRLRRRKQDSCTLNRLEGKEYFWIRRVITKFILCWIKVVFENFVFVIKYHSWTAQMFGPFLCSEIHIRAWTSVILSLYQYMFRMFLVLLGPNLLYGSATENFTSFFYVKPVKCLLLVCSSCCHKLITRENRWKSFRLQKLVWKWMTTDENRLPEVVVGEYVVRNGCNPESKPLISTPHISLMFCFSSVSRRLMEPNQVVLVFDY